MSATYLTPDSASRLVQHEAKVISSPNTNNIKLTTSLWQRFIRFSAAEEKNRFGWLAAAITLQACVLAPLTLLTLMVNQSPFFLWIPCILSFAVTEMVNLAAMPTRITIPVFFAGILLDVLVVLTAFTLF